MQRKVSQTACGRQAFCGFALVSGPGWPPPPHRGRCLPRERDQLSMLVLIMSSIPSLSPQRPVQAYPSCAQITTQNSGSTKPPGDSPSSADTHIPHYPSLTGGNDDAPPVAPPTQVTGGREEEGWQEEREENAQLSHQPRSPQPRPMCPGQRRLALELVLAGPRPLLPLEIPLRGGREWVPTTWAISKSQPR